MKNATLEQELESVQSKGVIEIPVNYSSFSVRMIAKLIEYSCPLNSVSIRTVQNAVKDLKDLGIELKCCQMGNTPYFDRFSTELIILQLKFKVKK